MVKGVSKTVVSLSLGLEVCLCCRSGDIATRTTAHASQLPIQMYDAGSLTWVPVPAL